MNSFNFYNIYGLKVKSDIKLYDSLLINNESNSSDIEILIDKVNFLNDNLCTNIDIFNFANNYVSFHVSNVGKFEITNGNKIVVEPSNNYNLENLKKFAIGSSLGLLLFQRNTIALHGGALVIDDNAIIISGNIGAGKTTTIASLVNKGYGFLSDDVSAITTDDKNEYFVNHCIPHQKLCETTAKMFNYNVDTLYQIDKTKNKYLTPEIENFIKIPKKLKALFYLTFSDNDEVTYKEIRGTEKFNIIFSNIFRKEFIPNSLIKPQYIKECIKLSNSISIYRVSRPKEKNSLNEVVLAIENLSKGDTCDGKLKSVL